MSDYNFKYRPQKISELDLLAVREGLFQVLKSGKIPQAFLFAGPRGTGKTSAARIVAKAVNCLKKRDLEPCNECDQCLSITVGNNLDVLEIDAASNRGIDDIRDLREKIKLAPTSARFKAYIIDEAHMLTPEAFNALLKTLEEPPAHALFVLCTTAPEKLPETIISRCLRFNFKKASLSEIREKLQKVAQKEKLQIEPAVFEEIAKAVRGSFRDALRVLEQASFSGQKITLPQIKEILGQTLGLEPEKLLKFLALDDVRLSLGEIKRVVEAGGNLRVYTEELLEILRANLLAKLGIFEEEIASPKIEEDSLKALQVEEIKALIEIFSRAAWELKEAIIPQLPLELAVVEWCVGKESKLEGEDDKSRLSKVEPFPVKMLVSQKEGKISLAEIQSRWPEVLTGVRPKNYSIEALLRATRPVDLTQKVLTIDVFYQFHKDKLETEKCRLVIEEVLAEIFGLPLLLKCNLATRPKTTKDTQIKKDYPEVEKFREPGNGETTDGDIIKVAEEIFGTKAD